MSIDYSKIQELLGDESETLLGHVSKTVSKDSLHLPGPDFIVSVRRMPASSRLSIAPQS